MQAIASSTSDRMPIMCDGSSFSDTSGGIRKPVALVRIVNSRKIAVSPGMRFRAEHSEHHDQARDNCDQTDDDMHENKRRQTHTQNHDAPPSLETF